MKKRLKKKNDKTPQTDYRHRHERKKQPDHRDQQGQNKSGVGGSRGQIGGSSDEDDDSDADGWLWWCWCSWTGATTVNNRNWTKLTSCAWGDREGVPQPFVSLTVGSYPLCLLLWMEDFVGGGVSTGGGWIVSHPWMTCCLLWGLSCMQNSYFRCRGLF